LNGEKGAQLQKYWLQVPGFHKGVRPGLMRMGQTNVPDPLPHPDDAMIDYRKNTVIVHGPMDKREQADLDLWLKKDKTAPEFEPYGDQLDGDIAHTKRILEIINIALDILASKACLERRMGQLGLKAKASANVTAIG
jgi:hypothetical protein